MLSGNKIRKIVMDLDNDEDNYYDSATEDEEPRPKIATVFHFTASKSGLFRQQL
jgi:hypothetical protein